MIEWNGRPLYGKSDREVCDIIAESKQEANVELIVSRSMGSRRAAQANWRQSAAHRGTRPPSIVLHIERLHTSTACCIFH